MASDIIAVEPATPMWSALYDKEVEAIREALGPDAAGLQFEHIGSTAVPGLAAKPIIDILLKGMPPFGSRRTHHLHVRPRVSAVPILEFRDRLRRHPAPT